MKDDGYFWIKLGQTSMVFSCIISGLPDEDISWMPLNGGLHLFK
jgi:hypothetical protein